jgi:hypothetical protein
MRLTHLVRMPRDSRPAHSRQDVRVGHPARLAVDWLFRDRRTGRITIAQWPNIALTVWLAATVLERVMDPAGRAGSALTVVATGSLLWWATDEVLRGVNPWRRILGGAVLAGSVLRILS